MTIWEHRDQRIWRVIGCRYDKALAGQPLSENGVACRHDSGTVFQENKRKRPPFFQCCFKAGVRADALRKIRLQFPFCRYCSCGPLVHIWCDKRSAQRRIPESDNQIAVAGCISEYRHPGADRMTTVGWGKVKDCLATLRGQGSEH
jgi:hypothetical protein